ncbi:5287_t:CDS:2 [Diversispora eburnea]|uniref:Biogenesis of lysosome-related organelles complex 1 subunit 7 n=1 Tax=Diversispora eburnea TaxID=1213867 RepID=A0A9N8UY78_9GLOM|nr:5287_t:CDS:2 [Diversispora eburnea]
MELVNDEFIDLDLSTPTTSTAKAVENVENLENIENNINVKNKKNIEDIENTENTDNNTDTSYKNSSNSGTTTPTHNETLGDDNNDPSGNISQNNNSSGSINNVTNISLDKEKFVKGLSILLKPVIEEMDNRIVAVKTSQLELNKEIERLLAELQLFVEATEAPPIQPSIQKLAVARRKLANTNQTLKIVHDRVDRMYAQLSKENAINNKSAAS